MHETDSGPNIDYVYILGASHSGSTLLALLLNAHPDVATIGETAPGRMGDVDTYRCSCGELIQKCPFWTSIARRMQERYPDFSLSDFGTRFEFPSSRLINRILRCEHRGVLLECVRDMALGLSPRWRRSQRAIMARCHDLAVAVLAESGRHVFVDSSKLAHRLKFLLRIPNLNIKVVHLVRDGRAVALTYMKQDEFADSREPSRRRGGRGMAAEPTAASLSMERAANEWLCSLRSAEHLLARLDKSRWIRVHYEELCRNPDATLKSIHRFLGTDPRYALSNFRGVGHHIIGNGMRLDTTSEIVLDERWREELQEQDLQAFDKVAGEAIARYGYD
jgi:hypothetical protein